MRMIRYEGEERAAFLADLTEFHPLDGSLERGYCDCMHEIRERVAEAAYDKGVVATPVSKLSDIHKKVPSDLMAMDEAQISPFTAAFYEPGDAVIAAYERFVREVVAPWVNEPVYY